MVLIKVHFCFKWSEKSSGNEFKVKFLRKILHETIYEQNGSERDCVLEGMKKCCVEEFERGLCSDMFRNIFSKWICESGSSKLNWQVISEGIFQVVCYNAMWYFSCYVWKVIYVWGEGSLGDQGL